MADVCVVGGGAAGITIARRLRATGKTVMVLESGSTETEPATQALYQGEMSGIQTWQTDSTRFRYFGGSSNAWEGYSTPLLPEDFEPRDWIPSSGWPVRYDELVPFYQNAQRILQLPDFEYDAVTVAGEEGKPLLDFGPFVETHMYQFSPPARLGQLYFDELVQAENVLVVLHANVSNVVLNDSLGGIDRLEGQTLTGIKFTAEANQYVLCAGGIENVRLLLASNSQLAEGVANASGQVGVGFMEHPHYFGHTFLYGYPSVDSSFYRRHGTVIGGMPVDVMGALALPTAVRAEEKLPHVLVELVPSELNELVTGLNPTNLDALQHGVGGAGNSFVLHFRAEQRRESSSGITLRENDLDALGMPRVDVHWAIHDDDLSSYRRAAEVVAASLMSSGLGNVWVELDADRVYAGTPRPGSHHMGTTIMGDDSASSVVDGQCKSHDLTNMYIAGPGVFPTGGAANPMLTTVALADRLGLHLGGL